MKKFLLAILVMATITASAQTKFGLKGGVNLANVNISSQGINLSPDALTSFHLTGFTEFALGEKFAIQPGLSFQGKGFKFKLEDEDSGMSVEAQANLSYLEIPVNAVLNLPVGEGSLFLGAGPYAAFGLFGKQEGSVFGEDVVGEDDKVSFGSGEEDDFSATDFGLNLMAGYRLKSGLLFNVGYGIGLSNMIPESQREGDSKANNKVLSFSVGFAF
ncbi:porin family protein [Pedobacter glucosidilyticus]|uniref:porin family protein n=1 Tax=Pedobacter glucosidilyticus TaxID=1122941 RepID=UPI0026F1D43F|nr:porin family protein [Pedobacter glucosidilyticus]